MVKTDEPSKYSQRTTDDRHTAQRSGLVPLRRHRGCGDRHVLLPRGGASLSHCRKTSRRGKQQFALALHRRTTRNTLAARRHGIQIQPVAYAEARPRAPLDLQQPADLEATAIADDSSRRRSMQPLAQGAAARRCRPPAGRRSRRRTSPGAQLKQAQCLPEGNWQSMPAAAKACGCCNHGPVRGPS